MKGKKGFTLTEIMAVTVILILVVASAFSTYIMMAQYVKDAINQALLQGEARLAVEKMARNTREASDVDCSVSGDILTLTFTPGRIGQVGSDWDARYQLINGEIRYFPDTTLTDYTVIANNVNLDAGDQLFFDAGDGLITIDLKMVATFLNNQQQVHLTTIAKARNAD